MEEKRKEPSPKEEEKKPILKEKPGVSNKKGKLPLKGKTFPKREAESVKQLGLPLKRQTIITTTTTTKN